MRRLIFSEYSKLSSEEKDKALKEFVSPFTEEEKIEAKKYIEKRIKNFEKKYKMSSDEMIEKVFKTQEIREEFDHCTWIMLLDERKRNRKI